MIYATPVLKTAISTPSDTGYFWVSVLENYVLHEPLCKPGVRKGCLIHAFLNQQEKERDKIWHRIVKNSLSKSIV